MPGSVSPSQPDAAALLAAYDEQLRGTRPADLPHTTDGPLVLTEYPNEDRVTYRCLDGFAGPDLDALIARQRDRFAAKGRRLRWKTHAHELPADLADRLIAAGFEPEGTAKVMIAESAAIADRLVGHGSPPGVTIRQTAERADFERISALESAISGEDISWLTEVLTAQLENAPESCEVYLAEAGGEPVSTAFANYDAGTDFTQLWGGGTAAEWRGKGIYTALVAVRAARAAELGYRYLQVDTSADSTPILQRLGFVAVTTVTHYVFTPPTGN